MPRVPSAQAVRHGPKSKHVQAELAIQYKASRASAMTHTAVRDQQFQVKAQKRRTVDDLKTLKIITDGFYPSRYEFEWKHGMVHVGWRLQKGSFEYLQLRHLVRNADEKMQQAMQDLDIANIKWLEDTKRIPMRSLPAKPPQCPDDENNTLSNAPIEPSNVARKPTILPTLAFSLANNSLQLTEIQDTTCLSETHASSGQSPGPLKSKRTPNPTSKEFGSDFVRARGHAKPRPPDGDLHASKNRPPMDIEVPEGSPPPDLPTTPKTPLPPTSASDTGTARVRRTRSHTNPPRPKASKASSDGPSLDPSTALTPSRTIREDSPGLPAPDIYKPRTDFELIQNLLVDEICRRKELEEIIKAERQFSTDLTATYENKICAFDRTLDMALHMQKGLETQLLDARANSTQIEATLNKCRDDLSKMQAELVLEREERLRMTALLGEARRERETPSVLPALAQAVSFVDRLTARVMEDVV